MIKCALQYILEIKSNRLKSNQMLVFWRRGENRSTRRKTSRSRVENQQTQPTYDTESGNRARATLVGGECSTTAPSLLPYFNHSLISLRFPSEWKSADVTPVHKKDLLEPAENYRPISLLPIVNKVMERCVCNRLYAHVSQSITSFNTVSCAPARALHNFCAYSI